VRVVGGGEREQPGGDRLEAVELVEDDLDVALLVEPDDGVANVIGVRSSCEASRAKSRSRADARASASTATWRRRACQTIARNIAAISGTSLNSSMPWWCETEACRSAVPVVTMTTSRTRAVGHGFHSRKP
jgi:hypothetical protein